jgi:hypothetical protein
VDLRPGGGQQVGLRPGSDDPASTDDDEVVSDDLDLVQQVGGEQDGSAAIRLTAEQVAHPADACGVEPIGGLVEDQHLGVAEESVGDAQALPHAEGVVADPAVGFLGREADLVEHLRDPVGG